MNKISRRNFIKISTVGSAYLAIGVTFPRQVFSDTNLVGKSKNNSFSADIWLKVDQNNNCTVIIPESEMGQGIYTGLATLIAEELDIDWKNIKVERASSSSVYGRQSTGGSYSIRKRWRKFREVAAMARQIFIQSAAHLWGISETNCYTENGFVFEVKGDRKISYADLIKPANKQPLPENVELKTADEFKLIGKNIQRIDALDKVKGEAVFAIDVQLPDMLVATTVHPPIFGSTIGKINSHEVLKLAGVIKLIKIDNAVAIVAKDTWSAFKAAKALQVEWIENSDIINSKKIKQDLKLALQKPGATVVETGQLIINSSNTTVTAQYFAPFQAHATMEPMNCCVHIHDGVCEVWASTQSPTSAHEVAKSFYYNATDRLWKKARALFKAKEVDDVIVHTTLSGGGFGRRLQQDFVAEAVQIAVQISNPVKLIWRREEDIQHDFYRPIALSKLEAVIDADGYPISLSHHIASPSLRESLWPGYLKRKNEIDASAVEGAVNLAYEINHHKVSYSAYKTSIPLGFWRSVGSSINACHLESFIDELAQIKAIDPYKYRQNLLSNSPRLLNTLNKVAELSQWNKDKHAYYGIACHSSYGSHVAQVAKLIKVDQAFVIEQMYCVIDCGLAVNPDIIKSQLEGAIIFGLSSLKSEITISNGRVDQHNYYDFPILQFDKSPEINCEIIDSSEDPGGVGEPGVPPSIPAVLNAVYAATGDRVRELPIKSSVLML